jgi:hypothetical protein
MRLAIAPLANSGRSFLFYEQGFTESLNLLRAGGVKMRRQSLLVGMPSAPLLVIIALARTLLWRAF